MSTKPKYKVGDVFRWQSDYTGPYRERVNTVISDSNGHFSYDLQIIAGGRGSEIIGETTLDSFMELDFAWVAKERFDKDLETLLED